MNDLTPLEQYIVSNNRMWPFANYEVAAISDCGFTENSVTKDEFNKRIAEENRPEFVDHPDAKWFFCDAGGDWYKNTLKLKGYIGCYTTGWVKIQKGNPIGGWKESIMVRPDQLMKMAARVQHIIWVDIRELSDGQKNLAQEAFFKLGYRWRSSGKMVIELTDKVHIVGNTDGSMWNYRSEKRTPTHTFDQLME